MPVPRLLQPAVAATRRGLRAGAHRSWRLRRVLEIAERELATALTDPTYDDGAYFGDGRDPLDRLGLSGYERYDRITSNANLAAYLLWRIFPVERTLDVGAATGFVVEALRELDIDAQGCDVSRWAVEHASAGARGHLKVANLLTRLPYGDGAFELVSAFETLEHLPPADVPRALAELRRVCAGWLVCTIPSIGINDHGPHGFPNAKVRDEVLDRYQALGPAYDGPVPHEDLYRDAAGRPIEGHLTIASFRWWTARFAEAGFERCGELERTMHPHLARFDLSEFWNLYVLRVPGRPDPPAEVRSSPEVEALERRWNLLERAPSDRALHFLREGLGEPAVAAAKALARCSSASAPQG